MRTVISLILIVLGLELATVACSQEPNFVAIDSGIAHTCALREDGSAVCWGSDLDGGASPPNGRFTAISSGSFHTCALREDGSAVCWRSVTGQRPPLDERFTTISRGNAHTCALRENGSAVCWGSDSARHPRQTGALPLSAVATLTLARFVRTAAPSAGVVA